MAGSLKRPSPARFFKNNQLKFTKSILAGHGFALIEEADYRCMTSVLTIAGAGGTG